jgi:hypothetical protein
MARNWREVDWKKSTTTIARELNTSPANVSIQRRRYAPETIGNIRVNAIPGPAEKTFPLKTIREMGINPLVQIGPETLFVSSLKARKGDTEVIVTLPEFDRAFEERKQMIWGS